MTGSQQGHVAVVGGMRPALLLGDVCVGQGESLPWGLVVGLWGMPANLDKHRQTHPTRNCLSFTDTAAWVTDALALLPTSCLLT